MPVRGSDEKKTTGLPRRLTGERRVLRRKFRRVQDFESGSEGKRGVVTNLDSGILDSSRQFGADCDQEAREEQRTRLVESIGLYPARMESHRALSAEREDEGDGGGSGQSRVDELIRLTLDRDHDWLSYSALASPATTMSSSQPSGFTEKLKEGVKSFTGKEKNNGPNGALSGWGSGINGANAEATTNPTGFPAPKGKEYEQTCSTKMRPDVALELKLQIADHLPKCTLASMCATSRMHHIQLMPSLYSHIEMTHDEDGTRRAITLMETLCFYSSPSRSSHLSAHPAALLRELKLWLWFFPQEKSNSALETSKEFSRLRDLVENALVQIVRHSPEENCLLRVLHLYSNVGLDVAVSQLWLLRLSFGRLEELLLCPFDLPLLLRQTSFQFLELPGLKSIVHKEPMCHVVPAASDSSLVESFLRSLNLMPSASPGLTTLHIDFTWTAIEFPKIISELNSLRLPHLEAARFRFFLDDLDEGEEADFRPFLAAHPSLRDVSVPLGLADMPQYILPLLEIFAGHAQDFLAICDGTRPLQQLTISLYDHDYALGNGNSSTPYMATAGILAFMAMTPHRDLWSLALVNRPIHYDPVLLHALIEDKDEWQFFGLPLPSVELIAPTAPRLRHLELHISRNVDRYYFLSI
ncbi:hypothetical protein FB45DRAFT_1001531 [Roridomyces roridus]|uniref:Uncharacterized protein n=1 Tax=Roridomyces roridus TaxID=1738132 RepID=A0AAD7C1A7_9AGAR|nr:hypothetical protein FB45DRAFT_1001531 [Roridomyces roridus]